MTSKGINLPKVVDCGYRKVALEVIEFDDDFHSHMGQYSASRQKITVCLTGKPLEDYNTVLHELLHLVYDQYALDEKRAFRNQNRLSDMVRRDDKEIDEERCVNSMANGLTEIFHRNKQLTKWMEHQLKNG